MHNAQRNALHCQRFPTPKPVLDIDHDHTNAHTHERPPVAQMWPGMLTECVRTSSSTSASASAPCVAPVATVSAVRRSKKAATSPTNTSGSGQLCSSPATSRAANARTRDDGQPRQHARRCAPTCVLEFRIPSDKGIAKVGVVQYHVARNSIRREGESSRHAVASLGPLPNSPTPPKRPT